MKLSLFLRPRILPGTDLRVWIEAARIADECGFHSVHFGEHILIGPDKSEFPYGTFSYPDDTAWLEPLVTLGAMASATRRLRLSTGVLLAPLRPPLLLAKMAATLDVLSGGRAELAVGTGWQRAEYEAQNLPWETRYAVLEDTIRSCRGTWGESVDPTTYSFEPRPIQPRMPILFGVAATRRNIEMIARVGDGWAPVGLAPAAVSSGVTKLEDAFRGQGRTDEAIVRIDVPNVVAADGSVDIASTIQRAREYMDAGATVIGICPPPGANHIDDTRAFIGAIANAAG